MIFKRVLICGIILVVANFTMNFCYGHVVNVVDMQVSEFSLHDVRLLDGPFKDAQGYNAQWLLDLDPDRFLAWFRKEASLEPKGEVYGGWEKETIAGHSLGHYMSAIAFMYAQTHDDEYKKRCEYIVDQLAVVQEANCSGYMSAFPNGKKAFMEIYNGQIRSQGFDLNGIWVPWYTQHKLMAGLRDIYYNVGFEKALDVWRYHADWIEFVTSNLTDDSWQEMLNCEHGGINEVLADLYSVTGQDRYLKLAKKFYHKKVLNPLSMRQDKLTGLHANTQIPKVIGSARIYELTGEEKYKTIATYFWETVVGHYSYSNGGNSAEEYFGRPDELSKKMHDTTETCNTYNMLKLSRHLFQWQPSSKYMDFYERALLDHILAHQHPEKGGHLVYKGFLDMPARKGFSSPTESFWCCVGTGMENHSKYADTIYMHNAEQLYVNLFISSRLNWADKGLILTQQSQLPFGDTTSLSFDCKKTVKMTLKVRKPYWSDNLELYVNGVSRGIVLDDDGYISITRSFCGGDIVTIKTPLSLHVSSLPDKPERLSFMYGPTLLAAVLTTDGQPPLLVGETPDVLLAQMQINKPLNFTLYDAAYQLVGNSWREDPVRFVPLFSIAEQRYSVYLDTYTTKAWQEKQQVFIEQQKLLEQTEARTVDLVMLGQMQSERDHKLRSEKSNIGTFNGHKWRDSFNGWFEFDMKVSNDKSTILICTYWGSERGTRIFDITVDGEKVATQTLDNNKPGSFFDVKYEIPDDLTIGKDKVSVRFEAKENSYAGGVFEVRTAKRDDTDSLQ